MEYLEYFSVKLNELLCFPFLGLSGGPEREVFNRLILLQGTQISCFHPISLLTKDSRLKAVFVQVVARSPRGQLKH